MIKLSWKKEEINHTSKSSIFTNSDNTLKKYNLQSEMPMLSSTDNSEDMERKMEESVSSQKRKDPNK